MSRGRPHWLCDKDWYSFRWDCKKHDTIIGNMHRGNRHTCDRGDRPRYNRLQCQKSGCPRIKEFLNRKKNNETAK